MKKIPHLFFIFLTVLILQSCYYDNAEELYPSVNESNCDTLDISFAQFVLPLLTQYCVSCHSGTTPSGNVAIETYSDINTLALNGRLLGVIRHDPGFSPMPKSANKLPECNIKKLAAWIEDGAKNN